MIICPWCGTNYLTFQSNCKNCGGPLQASDGENRSTGLGENLPTPPSAPRPISNRYAWRLLSTDGWAISALVFGILGVVFSPLGAVLTIVSVTAFVGIPFLCLGVTFLGVAGGVFLWRYQQTQQVVNVLREGEATRGQITEIRENYSVTINGRYPWIIRYQFQANGQSQDGKVTTLNPPGLALQVGNPVSVLYLPTDPKWNSIYPHP
jgi:hypothetical protein